MAKTIFNTTEKSNFILNMTEEQYSKLASRGLVAAMMCIPLFTFIPEITDKASYAFSAGGLALGGVIAIILAFIGMMKKYIRKTALFPVCAMGAMVIWGFVSMMNSYDIQISTYGYTERGEGLLAILFYFGFFTTAASLKRETAIKTILNGIVGIGLLNSIVSLIQVFAAKLTHYKIISMEIDDSEIDAASGLSMSPLFLAMLLTFALIAALIGFITCDNKRFRVGYLCSAVLFAFVMMFTYSFIGICGLAFAALVAIVSVFKFKAPKLRLAAVPAIAAAAVLAVAIVNAGAVGNISSYRLYDGRILWWADGYMRADACGDFDSNVLDIDNTLDVYLYLNEKTMNIIENNPMTGTGPEQLVFPQIKTDGGLGEDASINDIIRLNTGTFDKVYNEYLYTAATRGIPSLIAMIMVLVPALFMGRKNSRKRNTNGAFAIAVMTLGGVLLYFIGCSSIAFAPVFWTVAGAACAEVDEVKQDKISKTAKKK